MPTILLDHPISQTAIELASEIERLSTCPIVFRAPNEFELVNVFANIPAGIAANNITADPGREWFGSVVINKQASDQQIIHELLHLRRNLVDMVWQVVPSIGHRYGVAFLDNAIEHYVIVPQEIDICNSRPIWVKNYIDLSRTCKTRNRFDVIMCYTFCQLVIPNTKASRLMAEKLAKSDFKKEAIDFAARASRLLHDKIELSRMHVDDLGIEPSSLRFGRLNPIKRLIEFKSIHG